MSTSLRLYNASLALAQPTLLGLLPALKTCVSLAVLAADSPI
jgi:hypothetical protein